MLYDIFFKMLQNKMIDIFKIQVEVIINFYVILIGYELNKLIGNMKLE